MKWKVAICQSAIGKALIVFLAASDRASLKPVFYLSLSLSTKESQAKDLGQQHTWGPVSQSI